MARSKRQVSSGMVDEAGKGHFAYEGLNRVLHEKARLGILTALRTSKDGLLFGDLKNLCSLTDGNLSRHLSVLQEAGLVEIVKSTGYGRIIVKCDQENAIKAVAEGVASTLADFPEIRNSLMTQLTMHYGVKAYKQEVKQEVQEVKSVEDAKTASGKRKRVRWSESEEAQLRAGVAELGEGEWAKILKQFSFDKCRTNVDLKDKWRNLNK